MLDERCSGRAGGEVFRIVTLREGLRREGRRVQTGEADTDDARWRQVVLQSTLAASALRNLLGHETPRRTMRSS